METTINDLILVYIEGQPAFFGRIEDITSDVKPGWWNVHIMILSIPLQMITWILEESQINGKSFTMGGIPIRIEKVESLYVKDDRTFLDKIQEKSKVVSLRGEKSEIQNDQDEEKTGKNNEKKVISLMDRIKKP